MKALLRSTNFVISTWTNGAANREEIVIYSPFRQLADTYLHFWGEEATDYAVRQINYALGTVECEIPAFRFEEGEKLNVLFCGSRQNRPGAVPIRAEGLVSPGRLRAPGAAFVVRVSGVEAGDFKVELELLRSRGDNQSIPSSFSGSVIVREGTLNKLYLSRLSK